MKKIKKCSVANCENKYRSKGFCNKHYLMFRKYRTTVKDITIDKRYKHNDSRCDLYHVWTAMKARCYNKNNKNYNRYGLRNILICEKWLNYNNFKSWSSISGYKKGLTLDRINNDKGYSPENCRWTTMLVQSNNRKNGLYIKIKEESKTLSEWCRILGCNYSTVYTRLKAGVPSQVAFKQ